MSRFSDVAQPGSDDTAKAFPDVVQENTQKLIEAFYPVINALNSGNQAAVTPPTIEEKNPYLIPGLVFAGVLGLLWLGTRK